MKYLDDHETEKYSITVLECDCGFHIGLDASYLDQVGDIQIKCPNCETIIDSGKVVWVKQHVI